MGLKNMNWLELIAEKNRREREYWEIIIEMNDRTK